MRRCRALLFAALLIWLVLALAVLSRLGQSRTSTCVALPPRWARRNNATLAAVEPVEPSFVLLWSTNATSFTLRSRRCIESILFHHPHATVRVYSNQLPRHFFREFTRRSFDVRVLRYNVTQLLQATPAAPWLERLDEWRRGPYFYSHVTDAVRLALLFRVGGVYLDTDVIVTSRIRLAAAAQPPLAAAAQPPVAAAAQPPVAGESAASSAAAAAAARAGSHRRALHDALGIESYADPRTGLLTLNGAVMAFGVGSRFLWNALAEFAADYKADRWSWNGPELLTRVQARCAASDGAAVQVEPPESFYPLHWKDVAAYADTRHPAADAEMWATIERRSYAVHVWNRKTAELRFAEGSLLHRLHNTWTVLPSRESCT